MDMDGDLKAAMAVIITSIIWLSILAGSHNAYDVNAYREGYGEGRSGLPERWENAIGGNKTK